MDKNQSSKFCHSGITRTHFQNLKKKGSDFFYHRTTLNRVPSEFQSSVGDNLANQSKLEVIARSRHKARDNVHVQATIGFGFTSDWLKKNGA